MACQFRLSNQRCLELEILWERWPVANLCVLEKWQPMLRWFEHSRRLSDRKNETKFSRATTNIGQPTVLWEPNHSD